MSTTVTYKDSILTTIENQTRTLKTAGKYMEGDIVLADITANNQNKSVTPTESEQEITADSGYTGLGTVTVLAIPNDYVGTAIPGRESLDLTVSGATVTAPAGYYSAAASKSVVSMTLPTSVASSATSGYTSKATIGRSTSDQYINIPPGYNSAGGYYKISAVANGSATAPASISGTAASISTGNGTLTLTKTVSVTPSVTAGYVSSGTAGNSSVSLTASVTIDPTPTVSGATVNIPAGYYASDTSKTIDNAGIAEVGLSVSENPTMSVDSNGLVTSSYYNVFIDGIKPVYSAGWVDTTSSTSANVNVHGTYQLPTQAATTITPTTSSQTAVTAGKYTTGDVTVDAIPVVTMVQDADNPLLYKPINSYEEFNAILTSGKKYVYGDPPNDTFAMITAYADGDELIYCYYTADTTSTDGNICMFCQAIYTSSGCQLSDTFSLYDTYDADVTASDVLSGKIFYNADGKQTGTIETKTTSDITTDDEYVIFPAGYYASTVEYQNAFGSVSVPNTTISTTPSISVSSSGLITASASASKTITPSVDAWGYVSTGHTTDGTITVSGSNTSQLSTQAATTITPTTSSQTAVSAGKYTTGDVTVAAIPSNYIVPSGSINITENETVDVTNYASAVVNVPSSGGVTNVVTGTFTGTTEGAALTVPLNYTGSGFPLAAIIFPAEGAWNAEGTYYNTLHRYAFDIFAIAKCDSDAPTYTTSEYKNSAVTFSYYKYSTSDSTSMSKSVTKNANTFRSGDSKPYTDQAVRFKSSTEMSVFISSTSYGFLVNIPYTYCVLYSS